MIRIAAIAFLFLIAGCQPTINDPIPTIRITCSEGIPLTEKTPCFLEYSSRFDRFRMGIKIKRRGGWSIQFAKHSYTFELNRPYPLAGLPIEDDWILNANYIDKTFLRHTLSYDLFREMHPENYAPRYAYVRLYQQGDFQGLYILMERPDANRLKLKKKKGLLFKDPPIFHYPESVADPENYYHQKHPDQDRVDATGLLDRFRNFLFESSDSTFMHPQTGIASKVDLRNIIDWHVLLLLSNNSDGVKKNFYWYRTREEDLFQIAPWDYDHGYGRDGDNEFNLLERRVEPERSELLRRLMATNAYNYRTKLTHRWNELRTGILNEDQLLSRIDGMVEYITPYIPENRERWPDNGMGYYDANDFQAEITLMKEYLHIRLAELDVYFSELVEEERNK